MNIIISGYGRMGREVEAAALNRGHQVLAKIDRESDWKQLENIDLTDSVVVDFSQPEVVLGILDRCFKAGVPVVTGTTGWHDKINDVAKNCQQNRGTLFYAPNFSIGVNIFFRANKQLARLMSGINGYSITIEETHHVHKLDAPSGTAIAIAEGIIEQSSVISKWVNENTDKDNELSILSKREGEVTGTHEVFYDSDEDTLSIKHLAKNRGGFASGAVLAAEFVLGKVGIYTMDDLLDKI